MTGVELEYGCCCFCRFFLQLLLLEKVEEEEDEKKEEDCSRSCVVYCLSLIHAEMSAVLCKYSISSANGFIAAWRCWMVISG